MRNEREMMDLILNTAIEDDRIRGVILSGSRTDLNARKDPFQDYDVIYIVREIETFTANHNWVDVFGERIMMQMPEAKVTPPPSNEGHFVYLMQFKDGNRIDLTLIPLEKADDKLQGLDGLNVVLLDKDNAVQLPPASDSEYWVKQPSNEEFQDVCNEFWWICLNISKGLWRNELTYALFMKEQINRNVLIRMLAWRVGIETGFTKSVGKLGKHLERLIGHEDWSKFIATYSDANNLRIWDSLFHMCRLFRETALHVAKHFGFEYPSSDDENVMEYLHHVRNLPPDATEY